MSELTPQDLLIQAVHAGDTAGIDAALTQGANFTDEGIEPLFWAAVDGRTDVVRHLLVRGATIGAEWATNSRGEPRSVYGDTALHAAAEHGHIDILGLLLAADGKCFLNTFGINSGGRATPLGVAAKFGCLEACRLLLAAGADVNAHDAASVGDTPLCEAVIHGHVEVAQLLLAAGADSAIPGWMSLSARDRAARGDGGEAMRALAWTSPSATSRQS